jgi:hypothetical protein
MAQAQTGSIPTPHRAIYQHLYFQVVCAIIIGILLEYFYPKLGEQIRGCSCGLSDSMPVWSRPTPD